MKILTRNLFVAFFLPMITLISCSEDDKKTFDLWSELEGTWVITAAAGAEWTSIKEIIVPKSENLKHLD